ncbi:mandelate racemase/muconate lactonizing enzyme family protein [Variovorax sp. OV329]|uniref:mandelate racemase/muconate lactonizing enzyme family protein n=1 Tax=Variovorax sp. OV329 TaxID=1882825 RepID=UPI0008E0067B|nr:mandelate racemase/muconate lactonizing enzyme family protein [Variovorax sp. OV329]SFN52552.1 L-alanine-DL-glutamate epimerase [Variovorax sp. OV329]
MTNDSTTRHRIARVDIFPVEVPRHGSFDLQRGRTPRTSPFTVVRVTTDQGVVGWGEGDTQVRSLFTVARDHLADALVGDDAFNFTALHAKMDAIEMMVTERLGHWNCVRCAIDIALHDAMGRALNVPVYQLLGGKQRDSFEIVKNIGVSDSKTSAEIALRCTQDGYRNIKMRVGGNHSVDVARIRAVREAVGPDISIRIDANQAWTPKQAIQRIQDFEAYGIDSVEQPCKFWDLEGGAQVVRTVRTSIIADEGFWSANDARLLLQARAADTLHVYLGKCGGLRESMRIASLAQTFDADISVGERVPLGISEAAHAHYAAALSNAHFPAALAYDLNEHDLLCKPVRKEGGTMYVPEGPGLGIEVDEDALRHYAMKGAE